ncbi:MFS transporter [Corynebacterium dentalis]|uniref:MFS transporter n=1 Tax=Corynebacterium dentalis TaxID=2014528 RepID=UPI00289D09D2|nr:MFS transporter [Corynebacterium dentalis]
MLATQIRRYLFTNGVLTFGRVLPQAVLTPILVSKGLDFSQIILVQIAFTVATLVFEFPCGVLADRTSRKFVYLGSILLIASSYIIVFLGSGLWLMCMAWVIYGFSAAAQSSTMDYYFAERVRSDPVALKRFYSADQNVMLVMSIAAALGSSVLYNKLGNTIYVLSALFFCFSFIVGLLALPNRTSDVSKEGSQKISFDALADALKVALKNHTVISAILLLAATEFAVNPFFHLWQMLLLDIDISPTWFGLFFIAFQLMTILANFLFSRHHRGRRHDFALLLGILCIGAVCIMASNIFVLAGLLVILPLPLFMYLASLQTTLQGAIPASVMSSVGSLSGTITAVAGLFSLGFCSLVMTWFSPQFALGCSLVMFAGASIFMFASLSRKSVVSAI